MIHGGAGIQERLGNAPLEFPACAGLAGGVALSPANHMEGSVGVDALGPGLHHARDGCDLHSLTRVDALRLVVKAECRKRSLDRGNILMLEKAAPEPIVASRGMAKVDSPADFFP